MEELPAIIVILRSLIALHPGMIWNGLVFCWLAVYRHADVLLVNGSINMHDKERLLEIYNQAPKPILVVAIGACGCTGGLFTESYTFAGPVDKIIPVDAYIPGCPPKPEAIIAGIVKLVQNID